MQNINLTFYALDINGGDLQTGIAKYRGDEYKPNTSPGQPPIVNIGDNKKGTMVMDLRLSCEITKRSKIAFIVNNAMNKEYSLRPLKIEAPRTTAIQYTLSI